MMASAADLERWTAMGGAVEDAKGRKTYLAPSGKCLRSWKEAARLLDAATGARPPTPS